MPSKARPTVHGKKRVRQRVGVQSGLAERTIRNAWKKGITHGELPPDSSLKKWVDGYVIKRPATVRLYGQHMYLFTGSGRLITVLNVPEGLLKGGQDEH